MAGTSVRDTSQVELVIGGMTCASCANRVEKRLNRLDGVTASVNYATEKASVRFDERVSPDDLIAQVEKAGYTAALPVAEDRADEVGPLRLRLVISTLLALPVVALAMIAPLRFAYWQWVSLVLAAPVVLWGGLPFHRATWKNLKLRTATMDTLVSMGTGAAFVWSVYALVFGTAGEAGMRDAFSLTAGGGAGDIYLEVAAGVAVFILAGRYFEARAQRRARAAPRALLGLGAQEVAGLRDRGGGGGVRRSVGARGGRRAARRVRAARVRGGVAGGGGGVPGRRGGGGVCGVQLGLAVAGGGVGGAGAVGRRGRVGVACRLGCRV